jgi:hypothetical protein
MKLYTTLNLLLEQEDFNDRYRDVQQWVGYGYDKDAQIDMRTILDVSGIYGTVCAMQTVMDKSAAISIIRDFCKWRDADAADDDSASSSAVAACGDDEAASDYVKARAADAAYKRRIEKLREMLS